MGLQCGIVGLPNVGKSTIFNALTANEAPAENFPFCTIEPNIGIVQIPDTRLYRIRDIFDSPKVTPATVEFVDIAGLVRGASKGEGLGNQFLSHIRKVDAILHVVRAFLDENVTHVDGSVNPLRDIETIDLELIFKDMDSVKKRMGRLEKKAKAGEKGARSEMTILEKILPILEDFQPLRSIELSDDEKLKIHHMNLLSLKPIMFVINVNEDEILSNEHSKFSKEVESWAAGHSAGVMRLCGTIEQEISQMPIEEQFEICKDFGLPEPGLHKLIHRAYDFMGLQTFFTAGETEARAWTIHKGETAQQAAGEIHTDFARGFIKAEVYHYNDIDKLGSEKAVKVAGLMHLEGRDYIVQEGDVIYFHFNV